VTQLRSWGYKTPVITCPIRIDVLAEETVFDVSSSFSIGSIKVWQSAIRHEAAGQPRSFTDVTNSPFIRGLTVAR
jgi:hypothetical protein